MRGAADGRPLAAQPELSLSRLVLRNGRPAMTAGEADRASGPGPVLPLKPDD
jgi:hypothetical protein